MFKSLIKNTGTYFLINLLSQIAVFVFWIVAAKALSPAEVGIYVLSLFMIDIFVAFSLFGLDVSLTRFHYSEEKKESVLSNSIIIFIFSNILSLIILFILSGWIPYLIPGLSAILVKNLFLLSSIIVFSSFYNFALANYSALKEVKYFGLISLLQTAIFFVLSLSFLALGFNIVGIFYALLTSYLIPTLLFLAIELKNISFNLCSFKTINSIMHYGIPMMIYSVFGIFAVYIGRIFLDRYADLYTLGIYSFFLMIVLQVNGAWSTFNRTWTPEIFSRLKNDKEETLKKIKKMAVLSSFLYLSFMAIIVVLVKSGILGIFLRSEYLSNIRIFYILLFGPLFTGIYTACYPLFYYQNKTKLVSLISIILNLFNIFLTFFMIKNFGEMGAAFSFCIVSAITAFVFILSFKKIMEIPREIIEWSVLLFIFMSVTIFLFIKTSSDLLLLILIVLGALAAYKVGDFKINDLIKTNA